MYRIHIIIRALGLFALAAIIGDALGSMRRRGGAHRAGCRRAAGGDPNGHADTGTNSCADGHIQTNGHADACAIRLGPGRAGRFLPQHGWRKLGRQRELA